MVTLDQSKRLAALVGPSLLVVVGAELPFVQPHLYDVRSPQVVYLSGALLFVTGLALVRAHPVWTRDWRVLITLLGWGTLVLGTIRLFTADAAARGEPMGTSPQALGVELALMAYGLVLTYEGYRRRRDPLDH